ncbi:MAG TPA: C25 family cysteine peptidase [Phnomibacter sp.]|nr:C25 family cysteine peptidase [Phnomibacter sp.]
MATNKRPTKNVGRVLCCMLLVLQCLLSVQVQAQSFRNEWIDFSKTYYRFAVVPSVTITGTPSNLVNPGDYNKLYRIYFPALQSFGLEQTPVEHFQLWRNGEQVPVYITQSSGALASDGYLEFWGRANDGWADADLYRLPIYQTNKRWSMFSDTAYYYLTVNANGANLRIQNEVHDPLNTPGIPDSFFMHTITVSPKAGRNQGFALNINGAEIRSSSWDAGEGWGEARFGGTPYTVGLGKLFSNKNAPAKIQASVWAQGITNRTQTIQFRLNDSIIASKSFRRYASDSMLIDAIPLSRIDNNDSTLVAVRLPVLDNSYRSFVSKIKFTYPRKFEFNKKTTSFVFELPSSASGNLLKIVNFDTGASEKILIDLSNKKRYTAVRVADTLWFALSPSAITRSLVLTATDTAANKQQVQQVNQFTTRNFVNYSLAENQGDYLIISNKLLQNDNGSNYVEAYRAYRSSTAGGNFNAKVYDIDSLTEQFGNNIRKHPIAIRNFLRYSRAQFAAPPKAAFLIGRGATYDYNLADTNINRLNLVPTWGQPASDNLLAAANNETITPVTPIGRLAAITGAEVKDYLDKVIAFESVQQSETESKLWQKEMLHLIGGNDPSVVDPIKAYMQNYENLIKDTMVGAHVSTYLRLNDPNTSANNLAIQQAVKNGTSIITYFGHSSASNFDFNLNKPEELEYTYGRLPVFLANGCKASEFFNLNPRRYNQQQLTLSEKFVLSKDKGSIAFIASTHAGILQYLDYYTDFWYRGVASTLYGKSLGEIHQQAIEKMLATTTLTDQAARMTAEETHLHGDPVLRIHTQSLPDYVAAADKISISPGKVSVGNDSIMVAIQVNNEGKATEDSLEVQIIRVLPNGNRITVADTVVVNLSNIFSMQAKFAVGGTKEAGTNRIIVQVDAPGKIDETNEDNNLATKEFEVANSGIHPILPQNFGIVNNWPGLLVASPENIEADSATYRMQMDTTLAFNSPLLYTLDSTTKNGAIQFTPSNSLLPGTVYYWRTAQVVGGVADHWSTASFTYLPTSSKGFNQGHYYQHQQSLFTRMYLDDADRNFRYNNKFNNLYIMHGIYPTSATEGLQFSVTPNGTSFIQSACIGSSIMINVFDSLSFAPFVNPKQLYTQVGGCAPNTADKLYNFEFPYAPAVNRKKVMDFLDSIPKGQIVAVRLVLDPPQDSAMVQYWKRDTTLYGSGNSLYHKLYNQGFKDLDSLYFPRTFSFVFKKGDSTQFKPTYILSEGLYDLPVLSADIPMTDTSAFMQSPWFGPALQWDSLRWQSKPIIEPNGIASDSIYTYVLGLHNSGSIDTLMRLNKSQQAVTLTGENAINATQYRYLSLVQKTDDSDNATPNQLDFWRLNYIPAPEGAMMPGHYFLFAKDSMGTKVDTVMRAGKDTLHFGVAFTNLGEVNYSDSLVARIHLEDSVGNKVPLLQKNLAPLVSGNSLHFYFAIPIPGDLIGNWKLYAGINAAGEQPEISITNNFIYQPLHILEKYPDHLRVFNGTGNWSDSSKWTPYGIPLCSDRVIINGQCVLDINDAVSDSLVISDTGSLTMNTAIANLNIGCSNLGGNKLMTVHGKLQMSDGTLHINGALLFADSSHFVQSGGTISIDPNSGDPATSFVFGKMDDPIPTHPLGILSFGSIGSTNGTDLSPYTQGVISVTGGTIHIVDAPATDSGYAFFFAPVNEQSILFDTTHQLILGSSNGDALGVSPGNALVIPVIQRGGTGTISFGHLIVHTSSVPGRKVVFTGPAGSKLIVRGMLKLEEGTIVELKDGLEIQLEYQHSSPD